MWKKFTTVCKTIYFFIVFIVSFGHKCSGKVVSYFSCVDKFIFAVFIQNMLCLSTGTASESKSPSEAGETG